MEQLTEDHSSSSTGSTGSSGTSTASSTSSTLSRIRQRRQADGSVRRQGRLVSLMGTAWEGYVYVSDAYVAAGSYLAWKHIQERSGKVLPHLPQLLEGCDFDWTYEQRETLYSPVYAVQQVVDATTRPHSPTSTLNVGGTSTTDTAQKKQQEQTKLTSREAGFGDDRTLLDFDIISTSSSNTSTAQDNGVNDEENEVNDEEKEVNAEIDEDDNDWQHPFALVGAAYSYVTLPLTIVGSALEVPMVSGSATSAALDEQPNLLFGRTIPTNAGDARAAALYYKSIGVTHLACLYIQDATWGDFYSADLKREASKQNITLYNIPYLEHDIESAIQKLKQSQYRYVFGILYNWKSVLEVAYDYGVIANPDYSWMAAEMIGWTDPEFALNRTSLDDEDEYEIREYKLGRALNGIGQIVLDVPYHERFSNAMEEFASSPSLRQEFINAHAEPDVWSQYDLEWTTPDASFYQQTNYDAVIALGLAACRTSGLFTGQELYDTLLDLKFEGTTGNVSFDNFTGSRNVDSVQYRIDNIYLSEDRSDDYMLRFESNLVARVAQGQVEHVYSFVYADNTTTMPSFLPPIEYEYNQVPFGAQLFGWIVAGLVMTMSSVFLLWTHYNRTRFVVQVSQPVFLIQLCVGTFIMAMAVIPMSFQATDEELKESASLSHRLNVACMSVPWFFMLGWVVALSALFSKAWRLNQLMQAGMEMRRIEVKALDVVGPFAVLMTINVAMLLGWTLVAPLEYIRVQENNVDSFGRSVESYGICQSESSAAVYFLVPMVVANFVGLLVATYQSYKGRNYPNAISETRYLAVSMASLLESLLLGVPIILMVTDNPTAFYLVGSTLLCICCMTILLPVFIPKYSYQGEGTDSVRATSAVSGMHANSALAGARFSSHRNLGTDQSTDEFALKSSASQDDTKEPFPWGKMSLRRTSVRKGRRPSVGLQSAQFLLGEQGTTHSAPHIRLRDQKSSELNQSANSVNSKGAGKL